MESAPGLELAGTYTSAKNAFLKRVHILDFLKEISRNLELYIKLSEIERLVGVFIKTIIPSAIHA